MSLLEVPVAHKNLVDPSIILNSASVIGVGHLGSDLALNISKLGLPELYLYDGDEVEERNLSGTCYRQSDCGQPKVSVLAGIIEEGSAQQRFVRAVSTYVTSASDLTEQTDFYLVGTDSIEGRIEILEAILNHRDPRKDQYLIDLRSRAPRSEVYGIPLADEVAVYWYRETMEAKLSDPTPPIHCNEANLVQTTKVTTAVATQLLCDVLSGFTSPIYFRINTAEYSVVRIPISLEEFQKELEHKLSKQPCQYCGKKHRTIRTRKRCEQDHQPQQKQDSQSHLPSREDLFG